MGILRSVGEKLGLRKDWAEEAGKIPQQEAQKIESLKKVQAEAEEQKRGKEYWAATAKEASQEQNTASYEKIMKAYIEHASGLGEQKEMEMLNNCAAELNSSVTARAKDGLTDLGQFFKKNLEKFGGAAEMGLTTAKDLTKRGVGGALRGIKETGLNVAEFAQLRVAKPAQEIYGKYSDEISKSLGIGAGVAETKYLAAQEWVKVNATREWDQGVEAYNKLRNGAGEIITSAPQKFKKWSEERALARAQKRTLKTELAAGVAETEAEEKTKIAKEKRGAAETAFQEYQRLETLFGQA